VKNDMLKTRDIIELLKGRKIVEASDNPVVFSAKRTITLVLDSGDRISVFGNDLSFSVLKKDQMLDILSHEIDQRESDLEILKRQLDKIKETTENK
jgi:hypothetical protein